jgi:hypothetical protein
METEHRGQPLLSAVLMRRMTRGFVSEAGGFSLTAWNCSRAVFSGAAQGQRHGRAPHQALYGRTGSGICRSYRRKPGCCAQSGAEALPLASPIPRIVRRTAL